MQQDNVGTDTFFVEPAIVSDDDGPLTLVLSGENAEGTDGIIANGAMSSGEKSMDHEVPSTSLNGDDDGEECAEDIEMSVSFVSEGIGNEELKDAFEKVGRRRSARKHKQISGLKTSAAYDKEKFAIHSESQRLIREAEVHLPAYKPRQYSTFVEFRKALRGEKSPPAPIHRTVENGTQNVNGGCHGRSAINSGVGCPAGRLTSTLSSSTIGVPATGILKLPEVLSPPRLLEANDDDVIDLLEDENPAKSARNTHLNKLLSRFIDSMKAADLSEKTDSKRTVEYSILTKVPDAQTGRLSLQLGTVAYKPNHSKAVTFTDRRMWARHRLELQAIMRSKRLRHYDERMQHYETPELSSKKSNNDSDEAEEWLECDESDFSTGTEQEEDEDMDEDEDEDGEVPNMSRIQKNVNPFADDEAEESDDNDSDDDDRVDDVGTSQLSATEICESLSGNSPAAVRAYQGLASRACTEPGEVDLFAIDTTLPVNSMSVVFIHLESLEAHDAYKMLPFAHHENPVPCDVSSAKILNRSWNGTPYSMLFSQKQIPLQDMGISEYLSIENNKSDGNLSNPPPLQAQICLSSTQLTLPEDVINNDPDHESAVLNTSSTQASLCAHGFGQNPQDASNISLFSNYENQSHFSSDAQTTQVNAKPSLNTDTESSAGAVNTHAADTQYPGETQEISKTRRRLKRLQNSGGNLDDEADFECASKRRALFSEQTPRIKGNREMSNLPDKSQAKNTHLADSADILTTVGDEDEEEEAGDCYDFIDIEGVDEGTECSSNSEIEVLRIPEREKSRPKYKPKDFIDDEAELSGDEAERAIYMDEEEDIDDDSDLHSLKDFVDEKAIDDRTGKLRRQVERVYNRIQNDDDQRRVRYLKEMFLEDGDLYEEDGRVRQRRFRWRGLDKEDLSYTKGTESDEEDEEGEEEGWVGGASVFSALVSQGAGVMSRWLLQGSSGSPSGKVSKTESASISSKDADTPSLLVKSIDGTSNMEFGGSSVSIVSLSLAVACEKCVFFYFSISILLCAFRFLISTKKLFSQRFSSNSHKESHRCSLDPLQRTISGRICSTVPLLCDHLLRHHFDELDIRSAKH
ncbi:unnamed protein product [Taenia asiatica]|uniref:Claspin n=1 Tax=Taenia asiatica TaxID=60517 RepID=A0A0R3W628_TAEAS|nr:unnamed protein product [Taenia asiatica]